MQANIAISPHYIFNVKVHCSIIVSCRVHHNVFIGQHLSIITFKSILIVLITSVFLHCFSWVLHRPVLQQVQEMVLMRGLEMRCNKVAIKQRDVMPDQVKFRVVWEYMEDISCMKIMLQKQWSHRLKSYLINSLMDLEVHQQNNSLLCRVCTANYRKLQKGTQ